MSHLGRALIKSPIAPWLLVFVLLNTVLPHDGGGNEVSRLATLAALTVEHTFRIDHVLWTTDWALSPNGHFYSNKPPGPALLGVPLYWLLDQLPLGLRSSDVGVRLIQHFEKRRVYAHVLSVALQVLPYALIVGLVDSALSDGGVSVAARTFAAVALLFGNTAALFMNSFFGHGLAAVFVLATALSLLRRSAFWAGMFSGWAALSDYGAAVLPPLLLVALVFGHERVRVVRACLLGLILPTVVFSLYHWRVFGHPLAIAPRYTNPAVIERSEQHRIGGVLTRTPDASVITKLLVGPERGLVFTQPWVLTVAALSVVTMLRSALRRRMNVELLFVTLSSFASLLWVVSTSIASWHEGYTPGPRYLSPVLPLFGVLAAYLLDIYPPRLRLFLRGALVPAVLLSVLVHATTILAPPEDPLWPHYWNLLRSATGLWPALRVLLVGAAFTWALASSWKLSRSARLSAPRTVRTTGSPR